MDHSCVARDRKRVNHKILTSLLAGESGIMMYPDLICFAEADARVTVNAADQYSRISISKMPL